MKMEAVAENMIAAFDLKPQTVLGCAAHEATSATGRLEK
jgi:hypothetical protein